jgi:hypothetical protein
MTAAALKSPSADSFAATGDPPVAAAPCPKQLSAANINPQTRLATDYLNHFNEAIMLLEMIPDMPDCASEIFDWRPLTYCEHFRASNFKERDLAIAAYDTVNPAVRARFEHLTSTMTAILVAVRDAMQQVSHDDTRARLAERAVEWLKPLVAHTGGVINGTPEADEIEAAPQADVDYIMTH